MRAITVWLIRFFPFAVLVYDLVARFHPRGGVEATISRVLYRWGLQYPWLPMAMAVALGILVGHLFVPQYVYPPR